MNMNRITIVRTLVCGALSALAVTFAAPVFAQEIKFSGEVKTGIYWNETQDEGKEKATKLSMGSKDDAGDPDNGQHGRYRLNVDYDNGKGFGMRVRMETHNTGNDAPSWPYAFGYGNFFEDNLTVAIGKLGGSPWSTGGPEMWKELENNSDFGMRVEYKPSWVPENIGKFNVGFVLNWFNAPMEASQGIVEPTLADVLAESVIGISWIHELMMVRFAVRLDSEYDREGRIPLDAGSEGGEFVYRIEEYMLRNLLPGLSVWALGHWNGVGAGDPEFYYFRNWLFAEYAPELFTAQLRFGFDYVDNRQDFYVKPSFYWHFLDKLISAGLMFGYCQDFGEGKVWAGSPYRYIEIEPKVQINFASSYIAFAYNFKREYLNDYPERLGKDPIRQTSWLNLRFCIYY